MLIVCCAAVSVPHSMIWAMPTEQGAEILGEERAGGQGLGAQEKSFLAPSQLSAYIRSIYGEAHWIEFSGGFSLWKGNTHLSSAAELRESAFTVSIDADTQLSKLGIFAGLRFGLSGIYLSEGIEMMLENFAMAGMIAVGSRGSSANASVWTKLGLLDVYVGGTFASSAYTFSCGATLSLLDGIITVSSNASFDDQAALTGSSGISITLADGLSYSANVRFGSSGIITVVAGQLHTKDLSVSSQGVWDSQGFDFTSTGKYSASVFELYGMFWVGRNSFTIDVGLAVQWEVLSPRLTVELDQHRIKWIRMEIESQLRL